MGGLSGIMNYLPGMANLQNAVDSGATSEMKQFGYLIASMTPQERKRPEIINPSRKKRIALGAGKTIADVNKLIKHLGKMQQLTHKLSGKKGEAKLKKMMAGMDPSGSSQGMGQMGGLPQMQAKSPFKKKYF